MVRSKAEAWLGLTDLPQPTCVRGWGKGLVMYCITFISLITSVFPFVPSQRLVRLLSINNVMVTRRLRLGSLRNRL